MYRSALAIMMAGFVFAFFTLPFAGIDLLIDAVGFLLVFNAVRPLAKLQPKFAATPALCLLLVASSALQLFLAGTALLAVFWLRTALQCALYRLLAGGFAALLQKQKRLATTLNTAFLLCAFATGGGAIAVAAWPAVAQAVAIVLLGSQLFLLAVLFYTCIRSNSLLY